MGLSSLLGQDTAVATLTRALESGTVHHAYRFEGPDGVGKETAARALFMALVCEHRRASPLGCGECSACRRAVAFSSTEPLVSQHPDVLLVERGLYPPELISGKSEASGISVEQIRQIVLPRIGFRPHEGRALCVMVRRAEELTLSAANALLKTLEEPPRDTYFVLLTDRPGRLLDTIRSRTLAVRFRPLPSTVVAELLAREGLDSALAAHAGGSLSRARALAEPEARAARVAFVEAADRALDASHAVAAVEFAESRPEGRDAQRELLAYLAGEYASRARAPRERGLWAARHLEVTRALEEIERNGTAALVLEAMITRLRAVR